MAYQFRAGTPYEGPTFTTPDGRIMSGDTYTSTSKRVEEVEAPSRPEKKAPAKKGK